MNIPITVICVPALGIGSGAIVLSAGTTGATGTFVNFIFFKVNQDKNFLFSIIKFLS